MKLIHLPLLLLLTGCVSNVHRIGRIGGTEFFSVHEQTIAGPNVAAIYQKLPDGTLQQVTVANGPGIGSAVVGAGGSVAASAVLRPARTTINGNGTSNADSESVTSSRASSGSESNSTGNSFVPPGQAKK